MGRRYRDRGREDPVPFGARHVLRRLYEEGYGDWALDYPEALKTLRAENLLHPLELRLTPKALAIYAPARKVPLVQTAPTPGLKRRYVDPAERERRALLISLYKARLLTEEETVEFEAMGYKAFYDQHKATERRLGPPAQAPTMNMTTAPPGARGRKPAEMQTSRESDAEVRARAAAFLKTRGIDPSVLDDPGNFKAFREASDRGVDFAEAFDL